MRLRLLFTVGLVLCLSKFGSPNECCRKTTVAAAPATTTATGNPEYSTLLIPKLLYI